MTKPILTANYCQDHVHLIIGTSAIAASRCSKSIEAGAIPILIAPKDAHVHHRLLEYIQDDKVQWIQKSFDDGDVSKYGRQAVDSIVDAVFITSGGSSTANVHISQLCKRLRIPINVVDTPQLCTFTLLATHSDGPLHIGISTSGQGCKLASRIRREIAASLPPQLGRAISILGALRQRICQEEYASRNKVEGADEEKIACSTDEDEAIVAQRPTFNRLVSDDDVGNLKSRRTRWLSQICEYWPLRRLAGITDADVEELLTSYQSGTSSISDRDSSHPGPAPKMILAGSGPGSPLLLTRVVHHAIMTSSTILADKLVPSAIIDMIPRRTKVHIARKFPGNADAAQEELLALGLAALERGETVLRLKQGDPYLYGRGAEELMFFKERGYQVIVLPGVTSALAGPVLGGITLTHRGISDKVIVCTGTGRKGAEVEMPSYKDGQRTVVILMGLHRLASIVTSLTSSSYPKDEHMDEGQAKADSNQATCPVSWPISTPCAVIERASCPDQRVVRSTLEHITAAVEEVGSRPPGLLVVGRSCAVMFSLDDTERKWVVEEGFREFDDFELADSHMALLEERDAGPRDSDNVMI